MARIKHLALIVAVKLVGLLRLAYHGLGKLLAPAAGGAGRTGGRLLRAAVLPAYALWQRGKRWLANANAASVTTPTATVNVAVGLALTIAVGAALSARSADATSHENLGRGAYIGAILQPTDQFTDDILWEDEGPAPAVATAPPDYLDAEALRGELQPSRATSTLVFSGSEDALLPFAAGPTGARTRTEVERYAVQPGDTMGSIARQFGLRVNTLLWANSLTERSLIRIGQQLVVPPVDGVLHTVKKGDTLASIAQRYRANADEISSFNKLAGTLTVGSVVVVPNGTPPAAPAPVRRATQPAQTPSGAVPPAAAPSSATRLQWPTNSRRITQYFTYRHNGVDVGNKVGQPIYAADDGVVLESRWNSGGYGYYIIVDHGGGVRTLYGHSSRLLVQRGEKVTRGQVIALIGSTGRSTGPHLHFEVIVGGVRRNPLSYTR